MASDRPKILNRSSDRMYVDVGPRPISPFVRSPACVTTLPERTKWASMSLDCSSTASADGLLEIVGCPYVAPWVALAKCHPPPCAGWAGPIEPACLCFPFFLFLLPRARAGPYRICPSGRPNRAGLSFFSFFLFLFCFNIF